MLERGLMNDMTLNHEDGIKKKSLQAFVPSLVWTRFSD